MDWPPKGGEQNKERDQERVDYEVFFPATSPNYGLGVHRGIKCLIMKSSSQPHHQTLVSEYLTVSWGGLVQQQTQQGWKSHS